MKLTATEMAVAAADPKHPQHHFAWGQLVGVALFGLAGYEGGPAVYANPQFLGQFIAGVSSLFHSAQAPTPAATPTPEPAPAGLPVVRPPMLFRGASSSQLGNEAAD